LSVDVRFDPDSDHDRAAPQYVAMGHFRTHALLDCLVSAANKGYRYRETECFGGLEIDDEL
jgi:hypothetical protein